MNLLDLPFELIVEIVSKDITAWVTLAIYYPKMYKFTQGHIQLFADLFTVVNDGIKQTMSYTTKTRTWTLFGKKHRLNDLPAVIYELNETQKWYRNDKLHRGHCKHPIRTYTTCVCPDSMPAVCDNTGVRKYHQCGIYYRPQDLPTFIDSIGTQRYVTGTTYILHRDTRVDGKLQPAVLFKNGEPIYVINGVSCDSDGRILGL